MSNCSFIITMSNCSSSFRRAAAELVMSLVRLICEPEPQARPPPVSPVRWRWRKLERSPACRHWLERSPACWHLLEHSPACWHRLVRASTFLVACALTAAFCLYCASQGLGRRALLILGPSAVFCLVFVSPRVQLSTLIVLQRTQTGGYTEYLVLRHSVVLVLGYSYSVVLSSTQLKP